MPESSMRMCVEKKKQVCVKLSDVLVVRGLRKHSRTVGEKQVIYNVTVKMTCSRLKISVLFGGYGVRKEE